MEFLGDDQPEDAVAEELEALIGGAGIGAGMRQGALEQIAVLEAMTETFLEVSRRR
jgi:hypothetical protein